MDHDPETTTSTTPPSPAADQRRLVVRMDAPERRALFARLEEEARREFREVSSMVCVLLQEAMDERARRRRGSKR